MAWAWTAPRAQRLLAVVAVVAAVLAPSPTAGKTVSGQFKLEAGDFDTGPEYEITKYSFAIGEGVVDGKFTYKDPHTWMTSPALYLFMDEAWDKYHSAPACVDKVSHAHANIPIGKLTQSHRDILNVGAGRANHSAMTELANGMVEWEFTWVIEQTVRTHGWFIIVADCALEQYNAQVPPMQYELHLFNPGRTHLPADEHGLPKLYLFVFLGMSLYLGYLGTLLKAHYEEARKVHLVIVLLLAAYVFQLLSFGCELGHLWRYKYNGFGMAALDYLSEILEGLSQTLISFVLICLASGWTLVETESDSSRANSVATIWNNPKAAFKGANAAVLGLVVAVVLSMVLQIANKGYDDDFSKFHDHESKPGLILVFLRFVLGISFIASLHFTIKSQQARGGERLVSFLKRLMLLGGLWFLSFPVLVCLAGLLPHYWRHWWVTAGVVLLQTLSLAILGHQFMSHHSTYFKLSTLADSGVLPGAGGLVRAPKVSRD